MFSAVSLTVRKKIQTIFLRRAGSGKKNSWSRSRPKRGRLLNPESHIQRIYKLFLPRTTVKSIKQHLSGYYIRRSGRRRRSTVWRPTTSSCHVAVPAIRDQNRFQREHQVGARTSHKLLIFFYFVCFLLNSKQVCAVSGYGT